MGRDAEAPVIIVRQKEKNGWKHPFISVFEPHRGEFSSIRHIDMLYRDSSFIALQVESCICPERAFLCKDIILNSIDGNEHIIGTEITFKGIYAVVSENTVGVHYLYLGKGETIRKGNISLVAENPVSACLVRKEGRWYYSSDGEAMVTIEGHTVKLVPGYDRILF